MPLSIDDGLEFDLGSLTAGTIRDEDEYAGVRVNVDARLASAQIRFHVDVNIGDPIWPEPVRVLVPRLRGGGPIEMAGYPLHMVHAEKIVTAVQRGTVNTRWRDFADVYILIRLHQVDGTSLHRACAEVVSHRNTPLEPLADTLEGFAGLAQAKWAAWRRRQGFEHLPKIFADVLTAFIRFADPAIIGSAVGPIWDPDAQSWGVAPPCYLDGN
ncbi:MAG: nucleotidyl transferase AbiEii/AbiGii toxin family protein [Propionibacteriaceae bacterium]|nr:nucleotidyl transferase AbiEii/AbiGii toxin family protein [Propionibacteriaceae bacterium]